MSVRRRFFYSILVGAIASPVLAQSRPATPEEVVRDFFKAEQEGRWLDAARLLDLKRFESIRRSFIPVDNAWRAPRLVTAEEMMKEQPDMPRAAAEYQVKKMREAYSYSQFDYLSRDFARVASIDSLRALPVDEAAARWLEAKGPQWRMELGRRASMLQPELQCPELPDSIRAAIAKELSTPSPKILGITTSSDSVRYAVIAPVFWGSGKGGQFEPPEGEFNLSPPTLTLRKVSGAWKIIPKLDMPGPDGFGGMAVNFSAVLTCVPNPPSK